ncbi:D-alanine--D-alanine ligase [Peredibacter starrii]|uniref:D-alanine--D-alanine ligase n=1 Tax=Peredibacter starrii TaxID=28202 RepID=A0AAX4HSY7_9BACT|nr:D-alanine--D-alanine ligase [Peredibacter starrii]WPU66311.1 D-alanine--D-alanine ligase [Peredibacter starrii]
MKKKNVLLLCGGGSSEHEVSLRSVKYYEDCMAQMPNVNTIKIEIDKQGQWVDAKGKRYLLDGKRYLRAFEQDGAPGTLIDVAIPCIHGSPGETGDLQSYFEMIGLAYFGCNSETSKMCFNKITTKMWATALGVANTPYIFVSENNEESAKKVEEFQKTHGDIVIKASNQGSSVGCYMIEAGKDTRKALNDAFALSPFVLIEKRMRPRELEVSAYEYDGKLQISYPGEIVTPSSTFYTYEEKYSSASESKTFIRAENVTPEQVKTITDYATKLYHGLKIRHLSRIDFFLDDGKIYLNEINTFPGSTSISMFPKMLEANGHSFVSYLEQHIASL